MRKEMKMSLKVHAFVFTLLSLVMARPWYAIAEESEAKVEVSKVIGLSPGQLPSITEMGVTGVGAKSVLDSLQSEVDTLVKPTKDSDSPGKLLLDLAVPTSPAFTLMGLTPDVVVRPTTTKELVTAILNGFDSRGNFQQGLALEVDWAKLFGPKLAVREYGNNKILANTKISFATAKGESDEDRAFRAAIGLYTLLWQKDDLRETYKTPKDGFYDQIEKRASDLRKEAGETPKEEAGETPKEEAGETPKEEAGETPKEEASSANVAALIKAQNFEKGVLAAVEEAKKEVIKEEREKQSFSSNWALGIAIGGINTRGSLLDQFQTNGAGVWTSYNRKLGGKTQLTFHGRYMDNEKVPDPQLANQFLKQDSWVVGGRLRWGSPDLVTYLEAGRFGIDPDNGASDNSTRYLFGIDTKLDNNQWLQLSFGFDKGRGDQDNNFVSTSFNWAFGKGPTIED